MHTSVNRVHAALEQEFHLLARGLPDGLQGPPALADDDAFLARLADMDHLRDRHRAVGAFLPVFGLDGDGVGQFLMQAQEDLLARDLGRQHAARHVGDLFRGIEPGSFGDEGREPRLQVHHAIAGGRRDHEDLVRDAGFVDLGGKFQKTLALDQIDLVERHDRLSSGLLETGDDARLVGSEPALGIDQEDDKVGILGAAPGGRNHGALEATTGTEDPRRVDEHELAPIECRDAGEAGARGLHLGRHDRHLLPDEAVEQGRLAGIRRADERDEAAAGRLLRLLVHGVPLSFDRSRLSIAAAAACSATRFEGPLARASPSPSTRTAISNSGA